MKLLNSNLFVLSTTGVVVNHPFGYSTNETYYIFNSSITNFTQDFWNKIQDPKSFESGEPIRISNNKNVKYVATVSTIITNNNTVFFIFLKSLMSFFLNKFVQKDCFLYNFGLKNRRNREIFDST